jgi:ABC-type branched-subunit amino acid transport system ATPase component
VTHVANLVDRMYDIERGEIVMSGPSEELANNEEL